MDALNRTQTLLKLLNMLKTPTRLYTPLQILQAFKNIKQALNNIKRFCTINRVKDAAKDKTKKKTQRVGIYFQQHF